MVYQPPGNIQQCTVLDILAWRMSGTKNIDLPIYFSGNIKLLDNVTVSIVGRKDVEKGVTPQGVRRTVALTDAVISFGALLVSKLSKDVEAVAAARAVNHGHFGIAVTAVSIDRAYPKSSGRLQEIFYQKGLLVSRFPLGSKAIDTEFRTVLASGLSDITVAVEAEDDKRSMVHRHLKKALSTGKTVLVCKSMADTNIEWVNKMMSRGDVQILDSVECLKNAILEVRQRRQEHVR